MIQSFRKYLLSLLMRSKQLAKVSKAEVEKEIKHLLSAGVLSKEEAAKLSHLVLAEINKEKEHYKQVAKREAKRELRRAKPLMRRALKKGKSVARTMATRAVNMYSKPFYGKHYSSSSKKSAKSKTSRKKKSR